MARTLREADRVEAAVQLWRACNLLAYSGNLRSMQHFVHPDLPSSGNSSSHNTGAHTLPHDNASTHLVVDVAKERAGHVCHGPVARRNAVHIHACACDSTKHAGCAVKLHARVVQ